jgi:uncharacterized protein
MAISIDGTKENHDRNRVLEGNIGTHDKVLSNIQRFVNKHPNYISNLGLITVFDPKTDLLSNEKFFIENDLPKIYFMNGVSPISTDYYNQFKVEDYEKFNNMIREMKSNYLDSKKNNIQVSDYATMLFEFELGSTILRSRKYDSKTSLIPYTGCCIPGMKWSVRVDGTIDMCERVNSTMPIGHIDEGLDLEKIVNVIDSYNASVANNCDGCTSNNLCSICYSHSNANGFFKKEDGFCERWKLQQQERLATIYTILEKQPDAFDHLQNDLERSFLFNM